MELEYIEKDEEMSVPNVVRSFYYATQNLFLLMKYSQLECNSYLTEWSVLNWKVSWE